VKTLAQLRADARAIFTAGLEAADPLAAIKRHAALVGERLIVGDQSYDLTAMRRILVAGCGKAAARMALALQELLGGRIAGGIVVVKYGHGTALQNIEVIEAGHPIPDQAGVAGASKIRDLVSSAGAADLILFVISGGGSALMPMPVEGLTLADKQDTTESLITSGATIHEVNAVRKHLSRLKGGRLAELAQQATLIALILSDVVGDDLDVIASGPTVADTTTFQDCLQIIERYNRHDKLPPAVVELLRRGARGEVAETPKPQSAIFHRVQNRIVASNRLALSAARERAESLGYRTTVLAHDVIGESRRAGAAFAVQLKENRSRRHEGEDPLCLISGGETTVTVRGDGLGGRNQEFALAAAVDIAELDNVVVLSAGTDGSDGPTEAAGAIVDGLTVERGRAQGLDAVEFLARNDSYHFLRASSDLLVTGPTLTNVMDLQVGLTA
jgi:hydroxypyruvate reductase